LNNHRLNIRKSSVAASAHCKFPMGNFAQHGTAQS
jgi:hypothetical protein